MMEEEKKRKILADILDSSIFAKSKSYKKLLAYLVEQSIKGVPPKEYSIAVEAFGKEADFNPNDDPTIRVYVGNLRKKLRSYYSNEGKKSKLRIEIPKGHYEVRFVEYAKKRKKDFLLGSTFLFTLLTILLALVVLFSLLKIHSLKQFTNQNQNRIAKSSVWADIIGSKLTTLIVLGDDFFFLKNTGVNQTIMRKHTINSEDELADFAAEHHSLKIIGKTPYAFIPWISILPLSHIVQILKADAQWSITYSSQVTPSDLLTNDIIFLGSFRNLYFLDQAFKDGSVEFSLGAKESSLKLDAQDSVHTFTREGLPVEAHTDYCLVRKIPGPNHNTLLFFVSFFESGIVGATDYLTNAEKLAQLANQLEESTGRLPKYFDIVFKTTGYSRTMLTTQIAYIKKIDEKSIVW